MGIHRDAAHVVMRGRRHRDRLCRRVDAGSDAAGIHGGEFLGEMLADKDKAKAERVMSAMMEMDKIDIAKLKEAADNL